MQLTIDLADYVGHWHQIDGSYTDGIVACWQTEDTIRIATLSQPASAEAVSQLDIDNATHVTSIDRPTPAIMQRLFAD